MTKENFFHILVIFCVTAVLSIQMFSDGLPIGHDYKNQIISYDLFISQINEGELYPRWLKDANQGLGGLNFFYYPPLVYYSASLINAITFDTLSIEHIISANILVWLFFSGLSFYVFANSITSKKLSLLGALIYIVTPYHFWHEIYMRNATAELSAYAWIPIIFLCLNPEKLQKPAYITLLSLSYAALIMSHIPSALFTSIFMGAYGVLMILPQQEFREKVKYSARFTISIIIGICLSCVYLYPAIFMMKHLNSQFLWSLDVLQYYKWYLWPQTDCPEPYLCKNLFSISTVQFFVPLILFLLLPRIEKIDTEYKKHAINFFLLSFLCFFLMTGFSKFIWDTFIPLQKIQFPWRLLVISDFLFITLIIQIFQNTSASALRASKTTMSIVAFIFLYVALCFYMTASLAMILYSNPYQDEDHFHQQVAAKLLTLEHIPHNKNMATSVHALVTMEPLPLVKVQSGNANTSVIHRTPRYLELKITAETSSTIQVRQFYFSGWKIKNKGTSTINQKEFELHDAKPFGQMEFSVQAGKHHIAIELETMAEEKTGAYISLASLTFLILYIILNLYISHKKRKP